MKCKLPFRVQGLGQGLLCEVPGRAPQYMGWGGREGC